jgi:hypothetical protein
MVDASGKAGRRSDLVGYALDGFGIYGPRADGGRRLKNAADLDACHGHSHEVQWDGAQAHPVRLRFTDEYPHLHRLLRRDAGRRASPRAGGAASGLASREPGGSTGEDRAGAGSGRAGAGSGGLDMGAALGPPPPNFTRAAPPATALAGHVGPRRDAAGAGRRDQDQFRALEIG